MGNISKDLDKESIADLGEWMDLMFLAQRNGVTKEQIKNFIEGRNDDEISKTTND